MTMPNEPQDSQNPPPSFWDRLLKGDEKNPPLAQNTAVIIGSLICLFPVGLFFMWRFANWDKRLKWGLSVGIPLMMLIGALLPDSPSKPGGSSSSAKSEETAAINAMTLLVVNLITENKSWGQTTPNRFHQLMQQAAKELGMGKKPTLRHLLAIRASSTDTTRANNRNVMTVRYGDEVTCTFVSRSSGQLVLMQVEVGGKKYTPLGTSGR